MNNNIFREIIGNQNAKNELKKALEMKNIPHSWLISGQKGIGKFKLVSAFVEVLFANIPGAIERIKLKTFNDLIEITHQKNLDITVDEIRKISKFLSLTSGENKYKIVVIDEAEYMNVSAANALLKILEEPPENSIIFLISNNTAKLLPTIKSRCLNLKMQPLSKKECELVIKQEISDETFNMCLGSPSLALDIKKYNIFGLYNNFLEIITLNDVEKIYNMPQLAENKISWSLIRIAITYLLNNIVKHMSSAFFRKNISTKESETFENISKKYSLKDWFKVIEQINTMLYEAELLHFDKKHTLIVVFNLLKIK